VTGDANTGRVILYADGRIRLQWGECDLVDGIVGISPGGDLSSASSLDLTEHGFFESTGAIYELFSTSNPFDLGGGLWKNDIGFIPDGSSYRLELQLTADARGRPRPPRDGRRGRRRAPTSYPRRRRPLRVVGPTPRRRPARADRRRSSSPASRSTLSDVETQARPGPRRCAGAGHERGASSPPRSRRTRAPRSSNSATVPSCRRESARRSRRSLHDPRIHTP
jgi:hypothetical protein